MFEGIFFKNCNTIWWSRFHQKQIRTCNIWSGSQSRKADTQHRSNPIHNNFGEHLHYT